MCEDEESVSYYRRRGALTALLINKSSFSPPSWQREDISSTVIFWVTEWRCAGIKTVLLTNIWERWKKLNVWWAHGGVKRKGWWGTYPLHVVFTKVVSPPWSVLVYREGLRGRETGLVPHLLHTPATSDRSRTVKPLETRTQWPVLLLSRCIAGPSSDPGQDWIQTSPSNSLSPVCLLFWDGPMGRHTGASGCSQGRLVGFTNSDNTGQGDLSYSRGKEGL